MAYGFCDAQCASLCGPRAPSLCCGCLPSIRESTSTRTFYSILLFLTTVAACFVQTPQIRNIVLEEFPGLGETCLTLKIGHNCEKFVGFMAVYRLCLASVAYHLILLLLTIGTSSSRGCRAGVHNGYWFYKLFLLLSLVAASFCIPSGSIFQQVGLYLGMIGAFFFIVIQAVCLVVFGHRWHEKWRLRSSGRCGGCWSLGIHLSSFMLMLFTVCAAFLLFYFYHRLDACLENRIFITTNSALCLVMWILSCLPCVRSNYDDQSRFLPATVVSVYVMYITWSALASEPPKPANEQGTIEFYSTMNSNYSMSVSAVRQSVLNNLIYCQPGTFSELVDTEFLSSYVGVILMFISALYGSISTSTQFQYVHQIPSNAEKNYCCCFKRIVMPEMGGQELVHDEEHRVAYNYTFFHLIFIFAYSYIMMQLTMWYRPEESDITLFGMNWPSVWIKMISSWLCILVYVCTLLWPRCIPGLNMRDIASSGAKTRKRYSADGDMEWVDMNMTSV